MSYSRIEAGRWIIARKEIEIYTGREFDLLSAMDAAQVSFAALQPKERDI